MPLNSNHAIADGFPGLKEVVEGRSVLEVTLYGSSLEGGGGVDRDVDLFVVVNEDIPYERRIVGWLDVIVLGFLEACRLGRLFDPLVTEPVLTGRTILGTPVIGAPALKSGIVSRPTLDHFLTRAKEVFGWTISSSGGLSELRNLIESRFALNVIDNLSYVASYLAFRAHYKNSPRVLTLEDLNRIYPESQIVTLRRMKNGRSVRGRELKNVTDRLVDTLTRQPAPDCEWVLRTPVYS